MSDFRPKFITFDCYGTLTRFRMGEMTREIFAGRLPAEQMDSVHPQTSPPIGSTRCLARGSPMPT